MATTLVLSVAEVLVLSVAEVLVLSVAEVLVLSVAETYSPGCNSSTFCVGLIRLFGGSEWEE